MTKPESVDAMSLYARIRSMLHYASADRGHEHWVSVSLVELERARVDLFQIAAERDEEIRLHRELREALEFWHKSRVQCDKCRANYKTMEDLLCAALEEGQDG